MIDWFVCFLFVFVFAGSGGGAGLSVEGVGKPGRHLVCGQTQHPQRARQGRLPGSCTAAYLPLSAVRVQTLGWLVGVCRDTTASRCSVSGHCSNASLLLLSCCLENVHTSLMRLSLFREVCESRGGRPGLSVLTSLLVFRGRKELFNRASALVTTCP